MASIDPMPPSRCHLSRRHLIAGALGLGGAAPLLAFAGPGACAPVDAPPRPPVGPPLGPPSPFSFERLKAWAQAASRRPYQPAPLAPDLASVDYDAIG